jgi:hypothetical protein
MTLRVRMIRKLAERINGVDLTKVQVGDALDLPARDARILIAEGWAQLIDLPPDAVPAQLVLEQESE